MMLKGHKIKYENKSMNKIDQILFSFFGVGYFPWAPGTAGSIAAWPLLFFCLRVNYFFPFLLGFLLLMLAHHRLAKYLKKLPAHEHHDPSWIVIDEVVGMLIGSVMLGTATSNFFLISFLLFFRFFDIVKVYPASWFDQRVDAWGILIDDVISGFYAAMLVLIFKYTLQYLGLDGFSSN